MIQVDRKYPCIVSTDKDSSILDKHLKKKQKKKRVFKVDPQKWAKIAEKF